MPKVNQSPLAQNAKIKIFNIEFPEALRKPLDLLYSNVRGARGKKRRKSILMPRLLPFTFCFLLFAAQLPLCLFRLPPLFPTPAARDRPDRTRQTRQLRPDSSAPPSDRFCRPPEPLLFLLLSLFLPLSRCIKIEFPEPKAPPSRLNIIGLGAFSGPLGIQC